MYISNMYISIVDRKDISNW